jgi:hypothetical protein
VAQASSGQHKEAEEVSKVSDVCSRSVVGAAAKGEREKQIHQYNKMNGTPTTLLVALPSGYNSP